MALNFRKVRIGLVNLLWDGVSNHDRAENAANRAIEFLEKSHNAEVVHIGESVNTRAQGIKAWKLFKAKDVDGVVLFNGTYSTGEIAAEILRNLDLPFAFWGIEELGLDQNSVTGSMIGLMPAATAAKYFDRKFVYMYGYLDDEEVMRRVKGFVDAVKAIAYLREATIGYIGVRPDGFQISNFDELAIKKLFGTEITMLSLYSFVNRMESISEDAIEADMKIQSEIFEIPPEHLGESKRLSRVYLALREYIDEKDLQALAVGCWPEFRNIDKRPFCAPHSRLSAEGVVSGCEGDVDGCLTMMVQYVMTDGEAPWWADFAGFYKGCTHWWHCGNAPHCNSVQKPKVDRVYEGLALNASMKAGTATVCRFNSIRGEYLIHAGVGKAKDLGRVLDGSNMFVELEGGNNEYVESLLENGIPHHNGLVYGDITYGLETFSKLTGIPMIKKV